MEKDRLGVEEDSLGLTVHGVEPNVLPLDVSRVVLCGVQFNGDSDSLLVLIIPVDRLIKDRHDQCRDSSQGHEKDAGLPKGVPNSKVHLECIAGGLLLVLLGPSVSLVKHLDSTGMAGLVASLPDSPFCSRSQERKNKKFFLACGGEDISPEGFHQLLPVDLS